MKCVYYSLVLGLLFLMGCASNTGQPDYLVKQNNTSGKNVNIKSASLTLTARNVNKVATKITRLIEQINGQLVSKKQYKNNKVKLVLNVPANQLDDVLSQITTYGDVSHKVIRITNVADTIIDTEARLKNLQAYSTV